MAGSGDTIPHRLLRQAADKPSTIAYQHKVSGRWQPTTWRTFGEQVRTAARALISLGFPRGGKVAILGFNRPEWVILDHAAMMAGGAAAGIYTTCSPEEVQYIVHHSEALVVLVEDAAQLAKVKAKRDELPLLRTIVMMRGSTATGDDVLTWDDFMARGESVAEAKLDERIDAIEQTDLATRRQHCVLRRVTREDSRQPQGSPPDGVFRSAADLGKVPRSTLGQAR
jgi:long-chain acyl-CoA synthetase